MSNNLYTFAKEDFLRGRLNWSGETQKVVLLSSVYSPNLDSHRYFTDWPAVTILAGPNTLSSLTHASGYAGAANTTFTAVTGVNTVSYIGVYTARGTTSGSPLIALIDTASGLPATANGGDISVQWDPGHDRWLYQLS